MKILPILLLTTSTLFAASSSSSSSSSHEFAFQHPRCTLDQNDINNLTRSLLTNTLSLDEFYERLKNDSDNDLAQEKLHSMLTLKKDPRAATLFTNALEMQQSWALWIESNKQRKGKTPTNLDYILANRCHAKAKEIVDTFHNVNNEKIKLLNSTTNLTLKKVPNLIKSLKIWHAFRYGEILYWVANILLQNGYQKHAFQLLREAADFGHVNSLQMLGEHFIKLENYSTAQTAFQKASTLGYGPASLSLGKMCDLRHIPCKFNKEQALLLYKTAAIQGSPEGMFLFANQQPIYDAVMCKYWFKKSADHGYPLAQYHLARMLEEETPAVSYALYEQIMGNSELLESIDPDDHQLREDAILRTASLSLHGYATYAPNISKAMELYRQITRTNGEAAYSLGVILRDGKGVYKIQHIQPEDLFKTSAALKFTLGMSEYAGILYDQGHKRNAYALLNEAIKIGSPFSENALAYYYSNEDQTEKAFNLFLSASLKGHPTAMYDLAVSYYYGDSCPQDHAKAFEWAHSLSMLTLDSELYEGGKNIKIRTSTKINEVLARGHFLLADLYEKGFPGQEINSEKALEHFTIAAEMGYRTAQTELGLIALNGRLGQKINVEHAMSVLRTQAHNGCTIALAYLAHELSHNVETRGEAIELYKKSKLLNNASILHNLGILLTEKVETRKAGIRYITSAAHKGTVASMSFLISTYINSESEKDLKKAMFWATRAAALGDLRALKYLEIAKTPIREEKQESEETEISAMESNPITTQPIIEMKIFGNTEDKAETSNDSSESDEDVESSTSTSSSSSYASSSSDVYTPEEYPSYPIIKNPKTIRANLKRMGQIQEEMKVVTPKLETRAQRIADQILARQEADHNDLRILFEDPAFGGKVDIYTTKNGLTISTLQKTIGTHKAHRNSKTKAFQADVRKLLEEVFPWTKQL